MKPGSKVRVFGLYDGIVTKPTINHLAREGFAVVLFKPNGPAILANVALTDLTLITPAPEKEKK